MAIRSKVLLERRNDELQQLNAGDGIQEVSSKKFNLVPGVGIISYLPLQMSLYFNVSYSPFWILSLAVGLEAKFAALDTLYKCISVVLYVALALIEVGRLYLGYEGNLREKVSELASFWLLSLLQLPLVIYLMANISTVILPLEWAVNIPVVVFLLFELITGLVALQLLVKAQGIKFQVNQLHPHLVQIRQKEE